MTRVMRLLLALVLLMSASAAHALENRLAQHPSPYLAMHGQDPVHWQSWSREVLEIARQQGKLIFISSGYFACHWCHVMQKESYQNTQVAAFLNQHFIPVKLDRELEPALDAHLIDFVQRTQGSAGWPLNVFLTPEGYPLVGATYLPAENFQTLLDRLQKIWSQDVDKVRDMARRALLAIIQQRDAAGTPDTKATGKLGETLVSRALQYGDEMLGGFGQQNRFPMTPQLTVLLKLQAKSANLELAAFLALTLDQMARQGLRDHLAGGFYRYTIDPDWQIPHYEKMLYTQALLSMLFLQAADVLDRPDYRLVAEDTLEFVLTYMAGRQGGYVASFSAVDDQNREGGYYLWTQDELQEVLKGEWLEPAVRHWRLGAGVDSGETVLPRLGESAAEIAQATGGTTDQVTLTLTEARKKLLEARSKRVLPVDHKELAGWNGLLLAAFSAAAEALGRDDFKRAAAQLAEYLATRLWDGKTVYRAREADAPVGAASLEDYAYLAFGFTEWARVSADTTARQHARDILLKAWERFYVAPGWLQSDEAMLPGMPRNVAQDDGALPSPAALVIALSAASGDPQLVGRVSAANSQAMGVVQEQPFWYASHAWSLIEQQAGSLSSQPPGIQR